uniref:Caspase-1-A-like n=1 Tax=Myripristis murdjan TaxID=586833 RepID=A0A667XN39_9TELE
MPRRSNRWLIVPLSRERERHEKERDEWERQYGRQSHSPSSSKYAQRLFNVRRQFVDGVTAPVIKDLLNDLLADGVLNERERDSVLEERRARADQAECLIDMVRKKGNEASQKLIDHLKTRDSKLHP